MTTRAACIKQDAEDPFRNMRDQFHLPTGKIYLDGNSLGLMPLSARARVEKAVMQEWGEDLITSWNKHGWFHMPRVLGNRLARLIGGGEDNVIVADTISINLFKLLAAALALRPDRKVILSDTGNFPSDIYVAQGLGQLMGGQHALKLVEPEQVIGSIDATVAVVMVTEVDYRSARKHDMRALIKAAHKNGALVIWDLSHSAGAIPVDLMGDDADFAVGCTYKYINGGPGAAAFLFVHPRHQAAANPGLVGWWGHANPFGFDLDFKPADGVVRFQAGTQAILSMAALDAAMEVWDSVDIQQLATKGRAMCQLFIDLVESTCGAHGLKLAGPRNMHERGSHVSFHCPNGYAVMQALIARGVIGDFRAPDLIRFGFQPLYNTFTEVFDAVAQLADVLNSRAWDTPTFRAQKAVT